jgi:DNA-binding PadR family transcriptional regulator
MKSVPTLLVLKALERQSTHGYRIAAWINAASDGAIELKEGTLYPLLHQLEAKGLIVGEWEEDGGPRPVRIYHLTDRGRRQLQTDRSTWQQYSHGVNLVINQGGTAHDAV